VFSDNRRSTWPPARTNAPSAKTARTGTAQREKRRPARKLLRRAPTSQYALTREETKSVNLMLICEEVPSRQALSSCRQVLCATSREGSDTFQVLDQILFVCVAEVEFELRIIVVHHVKQRRKASVVKESTLLMRPQTR
jgi:hypothetical protein